jgi:chromosome segregation protein
MQLKSLEINGFKSFGDKTKLLFDQGITGIVGPNGCGKSNVVDAIRWVLGEQKTRKLRSEKMEEVIFNGTAKRKKASICEVAMTFENTRNILPTEYSTVTITRRLYRDGESEYLLNNVPCRLKDITNLFMDTGVGSDSYAIIELGMVKDILNDKDDSRKLLFEEAAGVAKYKIRKNQTLRKLEDTQKNLSRVDDLLFEIEGNLKTLEKQAKKAEKYLDLKAQYRELSSQLAFLKIRHLNEQYEAVAKDEQSTQEQIMGIQSTIAKFEARILELQKEVVDREKALADSQRDLNAHMDNIVKIENTKSIRNERLRYLQQREFAIGQQVETEKNQLDKSEAFLRQAEGELEAIKREQGLKEKEFQDLTEKYNQTKQIQQEQQRLLEESVVKLREAEQSVGKLIREKEIRQIRLESLHTELNRTEKEKTERSSDLDSFGVKLKEIQTITEQLSLEVENLKSQKDIAEEQVQQISERTNKLKDDIFRNTGIRNAKQNEYDLTKSLVENLEGFPESIKFLKKELTWAKEAPLLSDIFSCDEIYKVAFENFLDPWMNYYIVESRDEAVAGIRLLTNAARGRANFFIMNELRNYKPNTDLQIRNATPAIRLVDVNEKYQPLAQYLLDKVFMVSAEHEIPTDLPSGTVILTKEGSITEKRFILSGGSTGLFEGKRLGRAKNLEKLEKEIRNLDGKIQEEKSELDKLQTSLIRIKEQNLNKLYEEKNQIFLQKKQELGILKSREEEYRNFLASTGARSEDILSEIGIVQEEMIGLDPDIEAAKAVVSELQEKELIQKEAQQQASSQYTLVAETFNQENVAMVQLRNKVLNLEKDIERNRESETRIRENSVNLKKELEETKEEIQSLVEVNLQNDDEILELYQIKKEKEKATEALENALNVCKSSINQVDQNIRGERRKKDDLDNERNSIKDKTSSIKIELLSLKERMEVEFGIQLADLTEEILQSLPPETTLEELTLQVNKTREKIHSFGEVNPMAVEAYNELKERYDFIMTQKNDLVSAKESLMHTIAEIDHDAKAAFMDAFTRIRENFIKVFQTLFSEGDVCDLVLRNPDDPLDSDIDIIAKPKGKRPLNINQLSGGEQTLTAISLLFAIYLLKPAPFCVFDEVDAPLDDANIDKFNNIIREFSGNSQFIIVTHNKRTMVSTNVIYGVTMQDMGVSKVLPVSLEALNLN